MVSEKFAKGYNIATQPAQVVKLVDTPDLGSGASRYGGSSPLLGNPLPSLISMRSRKVQKPKPYKWDTSIYSNPFK